MCVLAGHTTMDDDTSYSTTERHMGGICGAVIVMVGLIVWPGQAVLCVLAVTAGLILPTLMSTLVTFLVGVFAFDAALISRIGDYWMDMGMVTRICWSMVVRGHGDYASSNDRTDECMALAGDHVATTFLRSLPLNLYATTETNVSHAFCTVLGYAVAVLGACILIGAVMDHMTVIMAYCTRRRAPPATPAPQNDRDEATQLALDLMQFLRQRNGRDYSLFMPGEGLVMDGDGHVRPMDGAAGEETPDDKEAAAVA